MGDGSTHIFGLSPITLAIIAVVLASAALLIYHFTVVLWCNPREVVSVAHQEMPHQQSATSFHDVPGSLENSVTALIPTCKYTSDNIGGLVSKSEDVTCCAVCLCEFKDGEAIRILPECLHIFHVPCIDAWLVSRPNCPLCRRNWCSVDGAPSAGT